MTIQQMAQQALDVQSACNLSGVVRSFQEITESMRMELKMDTRICNRNPISQLFAFQIATLAGISTGLSHDDYSRAYAACKELAAGQPVTFEG